MGNENTALLFDGIDFDGIYRFSGSRETSVSRTLFEAPSEYEMFNLEEKKEMDTKIKLGNLFILGDSYSTFAGYIPEGFAAWYSSEEVDRTDVRRVEQTWWHRLISNTETNLVLNSSWSGTTICHTGYDGADRSAISFVARLDRLIEEGFFKKNKIDTFLLFGGTNDSAANSPIGEVQYSDWTKEDLYNALPAFAYLVNRVQTEIPEAHFVVILNNHMKRELEENYIKICEHFGAEYILLEGINKISGHPSVMGMEQIYQQVARHFKKN